MSSAQDATCQFDLPGSTSSDEKALYVQVGVNDYGSIYVLFHQSQSSGRIPGTDDGGIWGWSATPGASVPDAAAQVGLTASGELINKGDVDCLVTTNGLIDGTTLNYRMSGGNPVVTKPAAIAFAKKLFQVCKDVISGK